MGLLYLYYTISLQAVTLLGLLDPEDAVITILRNVGTNQHLVKAQNTFIFINATKDLIVAIVAFYYRHGLAFRTEW